MEPNQAGAETAQGRKAHNFLKRLDNQNKTLSQQLAAPTFMHSSLHTRVVEASYSTKQKSNECKYCYHLLHSKVHVIVQLPKAYNFFTAHLNYLYTAHLGMLSMHCSIGNARKKTMQCWVDKLFRLQELPGNCRYCMCE